MSTITIPAGFDRYIVLVEFPPSGGPDYIRAEVFATSEDSAKAAAAIDHPAGEIHWAAVVTPDHLHVATSSRDCDGGHTSHHTEALPEAFDSEGEARSMRERLGAYVGADVTRSLMFGCEFSVSQHGNDHIIVSSETDEGFSSSAFYLCGDDLCDEFDKPATQTDQFAEMAGY